MKDDNNSNKPTQQEIQEGLLRVAFSSSVVSNLADTQQEILYYLTVEKFNAPKIAKIRKTSPQAVRKIIKKLRKLALINNKNLPNYEVDIGRGSSPPHPSGPQKKLMREYRLHAQAMVLEILSTSKKYFKILDCKTKDFHKKNSVQYHRRKLVIYSNTFFFGDTIEECFNKSDSYWTQFYKRLENDLGVVIVKGTKTNIYQFRCHIADVNNPLAVKVVTNKLKYKVIDDLGRVRLIIDNSHGLFEKEAVERNLCGEDLEKLGEFELDIISREGLKPSEAKEWITGIKEVLELKQQQDNENSLRLTGLIQVNTVLQKRVEYLERLSR